MKKTIRFTFHYTNVPRDVRLEENVALRLWDGERMLPPGGLKAAMFRLKNTNPLYYQQVIEGDVSHQQLVAVIESITGG